MSKSHAESPATTGWKLPFFTIWIGQAVSLLGSSLVQFALIWWLTEETGSATVLALATLTALLPKVILGPVAGTLVDRWNRRIIMLAADGGIALATVGLAVLFAVGEATTGAIAAILLVRALGEMFHQPAMSASTPLMVPEHHLARVAGLNQTINGTVTIIAPALGALLLESLPVQGVLAIDVITALIAILPLMVIAIPQPPRALDHVTGRPATSVLGDLAAGLRYVWAWPGLRVLLIMAMAITFCLVPAFALIPILVTEHFGGDVGDLGWFQSIWGAGLLVGGITLGVWGGFEQRIVTFLVGLTGLGGGLLLVGLMPFIPALGAMFAAGVMMPIHAGPYTAAVQASVDPAMQGRVMALLSSVTNGIAPVGLVLAGPLADWFGPNAWFVLAGSLCVLMGLGGFVIPALMAFPAKPGSEDQGRALAAGEL